MKILEYHREDHMITTDASKIDCESVHWFLTQYSYWAQHRPLEEVRRSMENSYNFGIFHHDTLVGYARVVTDATTFAWLCDVVIVPEQRGNGLGKWLVECITTHPDLAGIRRIILATRDAHGLYEKYGGFISLPNPERWMEKINPEAN